MTNMQRFGPETKVRLTINWINFIFDTVGNKLRRNIEFLSFSRIDEATLFGSMEPFEN